MKRGDDGNGGARHGRVERGPWLRSEVMSHDGNNEAKEREEGGGDVWWGEVFGA